MLYGESNTRDFNSFQLSIIILSWVIKWTFYKLKYVETHKRNHLLYKHCSFAVVLLKVRPRYMPTYGDNTLESFIRLQAARQSALHKNSGGRVILNTSTKV